MARPTVVTAHTQITAAKTNEIVGDMVSMSDGAAQTIQSALTLTGQVTHNSHVTQAADKYTQVDTLLLTPRAGILGIVEGFVWYDNATKTLKYYNGSKIMGLMTEVLAGQGAGSTTLLENKGVATVANGGTAAHGLGTTPTGCLVSVNHVQPYIVTYTLDATNITFTHNAVGNLTISWKAWL